jgi:hypothetical protein
VELRYAWIKLLSATHHVQRGFYTLHILGVLLGLHDLLPVLTGFLLIPPGFLLILPGLRKLASFLQVHHGPLRHSLNIIIRKSLGRRQSDH